MLKRGDWLELARKLDWDFSYVPETEIYPTAAAGTPWLPHDEWAGWDEPFRTSYAEYVTNQRAKDAALAAVREAVGKPEDVDRLPPEWQSAIKLHAATLPLAEFAAVIGNLRGARFGRDSAWRMTSTLGALDELRHTQVPLALLADLVRLDAQFDWIHKLYHSNNWVAIAARHMTDELLLGSDAIEFAIATNFVFETGFTNLQFIGLTAVARAVGDKLTERMLSTIQTDEARHAQVGPPVLATVARHDKARAQYLVDKWFWRSWHLFAMVTGFAMDYFTPLSARRQSFKEFMQEWVIDQYVGTLADFGLERPWYWDIFVDSLDYYHHMVYATAYTYRATVWFDFIAPGPQERAWLRAKYPRSWDAFDPIWERIAERWRQTTPGNDFSVHGTAIVSFCDLCQIVLCAGRPDYNSATVIRRGDHKFIFCSEPCRWIFESEPERYAAHRDIVKRVLAGEAPANLVALLRRYMGLDFDSWGKDLWGGQYPWIRDRARHAP